MIRQFTDTDSIVVARRAAASNDADMIIGASAKGPRGMASGAVLGGKRHVCVERSGQWYTGCINTVVTVIASHRKNSRVGVVDAKCGEETFGSMTRSTIGGGSRMWGRRIRRLSGCVNTVVIIVAGFTRLYRGIKQVVVENTTGHFER